MTDIDIDHLQTWIGREEIRDDLIAPFPVKGLAAVLDWAEEPPRLGDALPPAAHWLYFLDTAKQSTLGYDGHVARGGFLPPIPLPRRMWAGGRLNFDAPLCVGEKAKRISTVKKVSHKEGKTGHLIFVVVEHRVLNEAGETAIVEEHDIVYREAAKSDEAPPPPNPAPEGAQWSRPVQADAILLFRYSALTFNGHRIHYDQPFVTEDEGYRGLIVHGPLMATLMMDLCREKGPGQLLQFDYRAHRPVFTEKRPLKVAGRTPGPDGETELWIADQNGCLAMTATARFKVGQ